MLGNTSLKVNWKVSSFGLTNVLEIACLEKVTWWTEIEERRVTFPCATLGALWGSLILASPLLTRLSLLCWNKCTLERLAPNMTHLFDCLSLKRFPSLLNWLDDLFDYSISNWWSSFYFCWMQFVIYCYLVFHWFLSGRNSADLNFSSGFISNCVS